MLQILLIMLFQISLKIPHYAHYYSFYAHHCYCYYVVTTAFIYIIQYTIVVMLMLTFNVKSNNDITQVMR